MVVIRKCVKAHHGLHRLYIIINCFILISVICGGFYKGWYQIESSLNTFTKSFLMGLSFLMALAKGT